MKLAKPLTEAFPESPEQVCDGIDLIEAQKTARHTLQEMLSADRAMFDFLRGRVYGEGPNPGIAGIYCLLRSQRKRYLVMEFLGGENGEECSRRSPASFEQATPILYWLCQDSGEAQPAHGCGVSKFGAQVVDVGFARIAANPEKPLHGAVVVTPEYAAPGLVLGPGSNDPSVACTSAITLYELLNCKAGSENSVEGAHQVVTLCRLGGGDPEQASVPEEMVHAVAAPAAQPVQPAAIAKPRLTEIVSALLQNKLKVRIVLGTKPRATQPAATDDLFLMSFSEHHRQAV